MSNIPKGKKGEELARAELLRQGYKIVETNYRTRGGEIDIVAQHDRHLVFVEVKARTSNRFGTPLDAITPKKIGHIVATARSFMAERKVSGMPVRFDVVGVDIGPTSSQITVIKAAFDATGY